jgi:hypothetical protein
MRHRHLIRYHISVNIQSRMDVRVTHQFLLYRNAWRNVIQMGALKPCETASAQSIRILIPEYGWPLCLSGLMILSAVFPALAQGPQ